LATHRGDLKAAFRSISPLSVSNDLVAAEQPLRLEDFPHRTTDTIRLGDLDPQNHVNNAVYSTYFETGRVHLIRHAFAPLFGSDTSFVVARSEIDYLRELHWPGPVDIGTRIMRVGNSSLALDQAVFKDGVCFAKGRVIMVRVSRVTRRPEPFSRDVSAQLKAMIA
jgi:acyl-CoA thioester hydrolase